MSTVLNAGDLIQYRVWCLQAEQASVNTFYYLVSAPTGSPVTDLDGARTFDAAIASLYKAIMSTDASYRGVQANIVQRVPLPAAVFYNGSVGAGGEAPPDCPRQTCGLVSWQTQLAGRRYRGRFYMPFPSVGNVQTDGIPTAAYVTSLNNLASAIRNYNVITNVGATGNMAATLVIHHRPGKSPTPTVTPVSGQITSVKFATQRRRGSYGRANSSPI